MRAFIKTTKGNFPNQNFYLAWKGFTEMNFDVVKFEEEDLNDNTFIFSIGDLTPVFAGVTIFDKILQLKGITYNKFDTYPEILHPFMHRKVEKTTLGEFRTRWHSNEDDIPSLFMKPVQQKKFNGAVMTSILDWLPLANVPNDTEVYLTEKLNFHSEFRVYIQDNEIITAKHYAGDWDKIINKNVVLEAIDSFKEQAPCAYALDFGVDERERTTLIEFNDATSLGNYGLDSIHYAEMLAARWIEICNKR
jgi:hypothetical protein